MDALARIGEQRIREAVERGELDGNPLAGRPLEIEDVSGLPEELRLAYLALRTSGFANVAPAGSHSAHITLQDLLDMLRGADGPDLGHAGRPTAAQLRFDRRCAAHPPTTDDPALARYRDRARARLGSADPTPPSVRRS